MRGGAGAWLGAGLLLLAAAGYWASRRASSAAGAASGPDGLQELTVGLQRRPLPAPVAEWPSLALPLAQAASDFSSLIGEGFAAVKSAFLPRGIRNNNPGNIRRGQDWQGEAAGTDPSFEVFTAPEYGIRAMARILRNYVAGGHDTVRKIISRWAPPTENNTAAYVATVAAGLGLDPDAPVNLARDLPGLVAAIIRHENGIQPYDAATIQRGINLA